LIVYLIYNIVDVCKIRFEFKNKKKIYAINHIMVHKQFLTKLSE